MGVGRCPVRHRELKGGALTPQVQWTAQPDLNLPSPGVTGTRHSGPAPARAQEVVVGARTPPSPAARPGGLAQLCSTSGLIVGSHHPQPSPQPQDSSKSGLSFAHSALSVPRKGWGSLG